MDERIRGAVRDAWNIYALLSRCGEDDPRKRELERFIVEHNRTHEVTSRELIVIGLSRLKQQDAKRRAADMKSIEQMRACESAIKAAALPPGRLRLRA